MKGVPPTFVAPINEWYAWTPSPRVNPDVKVLLTLDESNFPLGVKNTLNGGDIPVAWINTRYSMVYLNYGHGDRIYSTPVLPTMIDNSVRFLLALARSRSGEAELRGIRRLCRVVRTADRRPWKVRRATAASGKSDGYVRWLRIADGLRYCGPVFLPYRPPAHRIALRKSRVNVGLSNSSSL